MTLALESDPKAIQRARARHLRDLFEPWSIRRLQTRTGLGRGTLQSRLTGETPLSMPEIEALAPVIRMTPAELFTELLNVECTPRDLNPEPTGYGLMPTRQVAVKPRSRTRRNSAPKGRAN